MSQWESRLTVTWELEPIRFVRDNHVTIEAGQKGSQLKFRSAMANKNERGSGRNSRQCRGRGLWRFIGQGKKLSIRDPDIRLGSILPEHTRWRFWKPKRRASEVLIYYECASNTRFHSAIFLTPIIPSLDIGTDIMAFFFFRLRRKWGLDSFGTRRGISEIGVRRRHFQI